VGGNYVVRRCYVPSGVSSVRAIFAEVSAIEAVLLSHEQDILTNAPKEPQLAVDEFQSRGGGAQPPFPLYSGYQ